MRTLFDFLRRLLELKHNEVVALEQLQLAAQEAALQLEVMTSEIVKVSAALEGIRESLEDRPDAEDYSVAWRVGVPKPEGE